MSYRKTFKWHNYSVKMILSHCCLELSVGTFCRLNTTKGNKYETKQQNIGTTNFF